MNHWNQEKKRKEKKKIVENSVELNAVQISTMTDLSTANAFRSTKKNHSKMIIKRITNFYKGEKTHIAYLYLEQANQENVIV